LDFWQADVNGAYDNVGFRFRGHQFTNAQGAFALTTIVPGLYPGRTRHIHVKMQAPGRPVLTTQLETISRNLFSLVRPECTDPVSMVLTPSADDSVGQ
jgi:protocatechuate 3,4-dioxygenase beta subunit